MSKMKLKDFNTAKTLQAIIRALCEIEQKINTEGALASIMVMDVYGVTDIVKPGELEETLGINYANICTVALESIKASIAAAKTSAQKEFDELAEIN